MVNIIKKTIGPALIIVLAAVASYLLFFDKPKKKPKFEKPKFSYHMAFYYRDTSERLYFDSILRAIIDTVRIDKVDTASDGTITAHTGRHTDTFWYWMQIDTMKIPVGKTVKDSLRKHYIPIPASWISLVTKPPR